MLPRATFACYSDLIDACEYVGMSNERLAVSLSLPSHSTLLASRLPWCRNAARGENDTRIDFPHVEAHQLAGKLTMFFFDWFLANVNSRSRSLYAVASPSVCHLLRSCT